MYQGEPILNIYSLPEELTQPLKLTVRPWKATFPKVKVCLPPIIFQVFFLFNFREGMWFKGAMLVSGYPGIPWKHLESFEVKFVFEKDWLFNRDPYILVYQNPHLTGVVFHPLYTLQSTRDLFSLSQMFGSKRSSKTGWENCFFLNPRKKKTVNSKERRLGDTFSSFKFFVEDMVSWSVHDC